MGDAPSMQPSGDWQPGDSAAGGPLVPSQTAVRCPVCRSIEWFRDCNVLVETETTGAVVYRCVLPSDPALVASRWACMSCAYEVPEPSLLRDRLNELAVAG
jgi:hypothetical protein